MQRKRKGKKARLGRHKVTVKGAPDHLCCLGLGLERRWGERPRVRTTIFSPLRVLTAQSCLTLVTPWTVACQAPPSMGSSRQEYWSALPFPSPGDLPDQGPNAGLLYCRQTLPEPPKDLRKRDSLWKTKAFDFKQLKLKMVRHHRGKNQLEILVLTWKVKVR